MKQFRFEMEDILNKELVLTSRSLSDTKNIAKMLAKLLKKNASENIFLMGDLGAGKTFLTNCLVKELGIKDFANSPSFKLINEYDAGDFKIFHFDLYRLDDVSEILYLGWDEYLNSGNLCIVEWAEKAKEIWPKNRIEISLEYFFDGIADDEIDLKKLKNKDFSQRIIKIKKVE